MRELEELTPAEEILFLRGEVARLENVIRLQAEMLTNTKNVVRLLADAYDIGKPPEGYALYKIGDPKSRITTGHVVTDHMIIDILEQFDHGVSITKIALEMGLHEVTVRRHIIASGREIRTNRTSEQIIEKMKTMWQEGKSVCQIAVETGKSKGAVTTQLAKAGLRPIQRYKRVAKLTQNHIIRTH